MEIRVGITNIGRELNFETDAAADEVRKTVIDALEAKSAAVTFSDNKGNTFVVPTASLAYVEFGTEESRRVGFVA